MAKGEYEYDVRATEDDGRESHFKYLHRAPTPLTQRESFYAGEPPATYVVVCMLSDTTVKARWRLAGRDGFSGFTS